MSLYSPGAVYWLDQMAVDLDRISEIELMQRAGECVWVRLIERWPETTAITVLVGNGNNGGDAFVVALCARAAGVHVQLLVQGDLNRQSEAARHFCQQWQASGGHQEVWRQQVLAGDLVVDGLLGIGLRRELDQDWQALITAINQHPGPKVAIDIPSGLDGLTGIPQPVAVRADLTVTFIGEKTGQYLADGPDYCGELVLENLGVSTAARARVPATLPVIESCRLPSPRQINTHKNCYGHILIVGGDQGMGGAVLLAARAALRSGAGVVTALMHPDCVSRFAPAAEVMVSDWSQLDVKLNQASLVIVGPGLGDSAAALACLQRLRNSELPMVVDASALRNDFLNGRDNTNVVITPHPGEAGRLLDITTASVQADRVEACHRLTERFGATCILKGSGTLVADTAQIVINRRGHPGMASAGMGDVLAGMVGAYLGQGLDGFDAACAAVFVHAVAADLFAIEQDQIGMIASDVIERIPRASREVRDGI